MARFDSEAFERTLARVPWVSRVVALAETGSTNDDALRLAAAGAPHGTVVVADLQTAGRGRLGRTWWSESGTTLLASWVMRPAEPPERWPPITLACGVAAAEVLRRLSGLAVSLKWPNDVMAGDHKIGGFLAEARPPDALVVGMGLNLSCAIPAELSATATSVARAGGVVPDRAELLAEILTELGAHPDALARYRELCSTIGLDVRVERSGVEPLLGVAADVAGSGALIVRTSRGEVSVPAGDVVHLRPA